MSTCSALAGPWAPQHGTVDRRESRDRARTGAKMPVVGGTSTAADEPGRS